MGSINFNIVVVIALLYHATSLPLKTYSIKPAFNSNEQSHILTLYSAPTNTDINSALPPQQQTLTPFIPSIPSLQPSLKEYSILALVPVIWGTYSPLISFIYDDTHSITPPTLIFNAISYLVSFSTLSIARNIRDKSQSTTSTSTPTSSLTSITEADINNKSNDDLKKLFFAGLELGLYLFMGSTLQLQGLQSTSPIKAGVLVQTTTIIVPLLDSILSNKKLPLNSYISCIIATIGIYFN
jgi:EamA-like transporter family